jgi:hypothetical protein
VGVTLGHADLTVPKEALDNVKRHALVHQEAGERMAQIMQSDVRQARTAPDAVPLTEQTGELCWEDVGARRIARRLLSSAMAARVQIGPLKWMPCFATSGSRLPQRFEALGRS